MSKRATFVLFQAGLLIFLLFFCYPYWVVYWPAPFLAQHANQLWATFAIGLGAIIVVRVKSVYGRDIWRNPARIFSLLAASVLFSWMILYSVTGVLAALTGASAKMDFSRCALVVKHSPGPDTLFSRPHKIALRFASNGRTDEVQFFYRRKLLNMGKISEGELAFVSGKESPFGLIVESIQPAGRKTGSGCSFPQ